MFEPLKSDLLFVVKSISVVRGGAERVLIDTVNELCWQGFACSIVSLDPADALPMYPVSKDVYWTKLGGNPRQRTGLRSLCSFITKLWTLISTFSRETMMVGVMSSAFIPLTVACLASRRRCYCWEHIDRKYYKYRFAEALFVYLSMKVSVSNIFVSRSQAVTHFGWNVRHDSIISNFCAFKRYTGPCSPIGDRLKILSIGRLEAQKNQHVLLRSVIVLNKLGFECELKIVGQGSEKNKLVLLSQSLGIEKSVEFLDEVDDVATLYMWADLFVLPSKHESFGLVVLEALTFGVPVVGFADCAGVVEIVDNNSTGVLVDRASEDTCLAHGVATVASRHAEFCANVRNHDLSKFTRDAAAREWQGLLLSHKKRFLLSVWSSRFLHGHGS